MALQGPNDTGTVTNTDIGNGLPWISPDNAKVQDSTDTTNAFPEGWESDYLDCTNFGFTIPDGSSIDGIQVAIRRKCEVSTGDIIDSTIQLIVGGTATGDNKSLSANWVSSYSTVTFGATNNLWGLTPTVAQVNASNFGVRIAAVCNTGGGNAHIDSVRISITYTPPAGFPTEMFRQPSNINTLLRM